MRSFGKTLLATGFAAGLVAIAPATAQDESGIGQAASNNATEIVCRRMPPPTGTRLGHRNICKTRADWVAQQEDARRETQQQQDRGHFSYDNN